MNRAVSLLVLILSAPVGAVAAERGAASKAVVSARIAALEKRLAASSATAGPAESSREERARRLLGAARLATTHDVLGVAMRTLDEVERLLPEAPSSEDEK